MTVLLVWPRPTALISQVPLLRPSPRQAKDILQKWAANNLTVSVQVPAPKPALYSMACLPAVIPSACCFPLGPFLTLWTLADLLQCQPFLSFNLDCTFILLLWLLWVCLGPEGLLHDHMAPHWSKRLTWPLLIPVPWKLQVYWTRTKSVSKLLVISLLHNYVSFLVCLCDVVSFCATSQEEHWA